MTNELTDLRRFITTHYNRDEIRTLCLDLLVDFEELRGEAKSVIVTELLLLLGRKRLFEKLLNLLRQDRGNLFEDSELSTSPAYLEALYQKHSILAQNSEHSNSTREGRERRQAVSFFCNVPYGLETSFSGRENELNILHEWLVDNPESPVFLFQAISGNGKSALSWYWQRNLKANTKIHNIKQIIWWSFYEAEADIHRFIEETLNWFRYRPSEMDSNLIRLNLLIEFLEENSTLLILDGIERLLAAFNPGAIHTDDNSDNFQKSATGLDALDCTDNISANLLVRLADLKSTKSLLTSQVIPLALKGQDESLIRGVQLYKLSGLNKNDAQDFFAEEGIKATPEEVEFLGEQIAYHPLSLRLIAGYVKNDPDLFNNLAAAVDYDPTNDVIGKKRHILSKAFYSLPILTQKLLNRLSAFYESVTINEIQIVANPIDPPNQERNIKNLPYIAVMDIEPIKNVSNHLRILNNRGLIQQSRYQNQTYYFLHPLIRSYAYQQSDEVQGIHKQLIFHYLRHLQINYATDQFKQKRNPHHKNHSDLNGKIQVYLHLISVEQYELAFKFLQGMLDEELRYKYGNYSLLNRLLSPFFSENEEHLTFLEDERLESGVLLMLSISYLGMGRPVNALRVGSYVAKQAHDSNPIAYLSSQEILSTAFRQLGQLKEAIWHRGYEMEILKLAAKEFDTDFEHFHLAISHQEYGFLQTIIGNWKQADEEYDLALSYFVASNRRQSENLVYTHQTYSHLLKGDAQSALFVGQKAYEFVSTHKNENDRIRLEWLLGWAYLQENNLVLAKKHLDDALKRCRSINYNPLEPSILLACARLAFAFGNIESSYEYLNHAQQIAERASYRLDLADIHNFYAELDIDSDNYSLAKDNIAKAKSFASISAPEYIYAFAYSTAEKLLVTLEGKAEH